MVIGVVALGYESRRGPLVELALLEADCERAHALRAHHRGEGCQRGRIEPAREQHADRHVCDQMCADRVTQPLPKFLSKLVEAF